MDKQTVFALVLISMLLAFVYQQFTSLTKPLPPPELDVSQFWGKGDQNSYNEDDSIEAQQIHYDDKIIDDLRAKLNDTASIQFHAPLESVNHEYGINSNTLVSFIEYWRDEYMPKWPQRQRLLNSYPHFRTQIQGLHIHYVHIKPSVSGKIVVPLLLLHGWPGSVREFFDMFPMLTTGKGSNYVFEVIAPSLPGYAWSEGSAKVGFGPAEVAVVLRNLMIRLGHERFLIQGGDWGSIIGSHLATIFPNNVIGYHSNFCMPKSTLSVVKLLVASLYPAAFIAPEFESFVFPLADKLKLIVQESGSFHIQATKPDTLGAVLTNPIALAAYLQEKFIMALPDHDIDAVLDNLMIYYLTNSFTTCARLYAEDVSAQQTAYELWRVPTTVPTCCVRFRNDIGQSLDWQLIDKYPNLVQSSWYQDGGHFAAMEVPHILYKDFVQFVEKIEHLL